MTVALVSSGWLYIAPDRSIMSCVSCCCTRVSVLLVCVEPGCCEDPANVLLSREPRHSCSVTASCRDKASHCSGMQHHQLATTTQPPAAAAAAFRHRQSISQQLSRPRQSYALRHASTIMIIYVYEKYLSMTHKIFIYNIKHFLSILGMCCV